jgi:hypothetical protein
MVVYSRADRGKREIVGMASDAVEQGERLLCVTARLEVQNRCIGT